jgi:hypothetical protein
MVDTESIEDVEKERERFREDTIASSISLSDVRLEPSSVSFVARIPSAMPFLMGRVSGIGKLDCA